MENPDAREFAKFGGFQFSHEMEVCFARIVKVLEEILFTKIKEFPHPTGILLANIHQNANAALSLTPDECLNEVYLIMRVLVDTGITFSCLLVSDDAERKKYFEQSPASPFLTSSTPEQLLEQAKALAEVDAIPPHRMNSVRERIEILGRKAGINRDAWLMVVASVFPHSSEVLCGGPYAYALRFMQGKVSGRSSQAADQFTMLHFVVGEFLYQIICICAKHVNMPELRAKAEAINSQSTNLMNAAKVGIADPVRGVWALLDKAEHSASLKLADALQEFEEAFQFSYEAGVIIPTLRHKIQNRDFRHAALYLRRTLNDFRAVWVLLATGYTSQASTCAGSLFETSLATICLLKPEKVREFESWQQSATGNDFPWKPMHMAKVVCAEGRLLDDPDPDYQNLWRALYARYVWLSQIRHSTFQSVTHDTNSATLDSGGYVIMAIPNSTENDLPVKIRIAIGALADLHQVITAWLKALGYVEKTGDSAFDERMQKVDAEIESLLRRHANLKNPITIQRTKFFRNHPPVPKN